nr:ribonuclease H-like domain-containing protein [Tanacetum cinerariifolium]
QIDDDDIEEMDIKWNLALLSIRADRFWKKTDKKITIRGSDVAGFDKSKVECFNCHKMGYFAREYRSPRSQDRGKRKSYKKDPKVEELAPKAMIAIDEEVPTEYALMAKSSSSSDNETFRKSKLDKDMKGVGFNEYYVVPPPPAQVYSHLKKDLSWMGLPEFVDDTFTDYTRPTPSIDVSKSINITTKHHQADMPAASASRRASRISKLACRQNQQADVPPASANRCAIKHQKADYTSRITKSTCQQQII